MPVASSELAPAPWEPEEIFLSAWSDALDDLPPRPIPAIPPKFDFADPMNPLVYCPVWLRAATAERSWIPLGDAPQLSVREQSRIMSGAHCPRCNGGGRNWGLHRGRDSGILAQLPVPCQCARYVPGSFLAHARLTAQNGSA